jgi:hypothetical protein
MEQTDWTREELKAYLLLYAANANYIETEEEKETILAMVNPETFKRIHRELAKDNDYQSIQKIQHNLQRFHYSLDGVDQLLKDIERVFNAKGEYSEVDETIRLALKRLLHACVEVN